MGLHVSRGPTPLTDFPTPERGAAVPTLFVAGGDSDYIRPEHQGEMDRLFPNSSTVVIPGAGHWVHAEAPHAFMKTVGDFLDADR